MQIAYQAYDEAFETRGGVLRWEDVDARYSISFLFQGSFGKRLLPAAANLKDPKVARHRTPA
eukprot:SAG31_NODE_12203_length_959_cov_1.083721_2_plen_62_part_00